MYCIGRRILVYMEIHMIQVPTMTRMMMQQLYTQGTIALA